jgi:hypothetical protein
MALPVFTKPTDLEERPHISFSEALTFYKCPYKHWENYRLKKPQEDTIYTIFGKAVGEALERYKKYDKKHSWITMGKKIFRFLLENGFGEFVNEKDQDWRIWARSSLRIFKDTLEYLDINFPGWELIDFEYPLYEQIEGSEKKFKGFVDLIFKHDGQLYLWDFKTCGWGWTPEQKSDTQKLYQITLYKHFYCQKNGIDPDEIKVAYLLLKRKPAKKAETSVELFEQTSGKKKIENALIWLKEQAEGIESGIKIKKKTTCAFCVCGAARN